MYLSFVIFMGILSQVWAQTTPSAPENTQTTENTTTYNGSIATTIQPNDSSILPETSNTTNSSTTTITVFTTAVPMLNTTLTTSHVLHRNQTTTPTQPMSSPQCPKPCNCRITTDTYAHNIWFIDCSNKKMDTLPVITIQDSIVSIDLSRNKLTALPSKAFSGIKGLEILNFRWNQIGEVAVDVFVGIEKNLKRLDLSNNKLKFVPTLVKKLERLKKLDLSFNRIGSLGQRSLQSYPHLEVLHIASNHISILKNPFFPIRERILEMYLDNNRLDNSVFQGINMCKKLKILSLSMNHLQSIPSGKVGRNVVVTLRKLVLNNTNLNVMPALDKFQNLIELDLKGNRIKDIMLPNEGRITETLEVLLLDDTGLKSMPNINNYKNLKTLSIKDNFIKTIAPLEDALQNLTYLNLVDNHMTEIPINFLRHHPLLEKLDMKDNNLTFIPPGAFSNSKHLKYLYLARNRIDTIETDAFLGLEQSLSVLGLNRNRIKTLNYCTFEKITNLFRMSISGNPLVCDCQILWLRKTSIRIKDTVCKSPIHHENTTVLRFPLTECPARIRQQTKPVCVPPMLLPATRQPTSSTVTSSRQTGLSPGATAGLVIGLLVILTLVGIVIFGVVKYKRGTGLKLWGRMI